MEYGDDHDDRMPRVSGRDIHRRVSLVVMHRVSSRVFSKCNRGHWMCCLPTPLQLNSQECCLSV